MGLKHTKRSDNNITINYELTAEIRCAVPKTFSPLFATRLRIKLLEF